MHRLQKAAHAPEEFMQSHWHAPDFHIGCLHIGKLSKQHSFREDAVRRISDDIEQLNVNRKLSPRRDKQQQKLHTLSEDVQRQLHLILESIKELTEEGKDKDDKSVGQKTKHQSSKDLKGDRETIDMLEQFLAADLPVQLLSQLASLEFEARKEVMNVCCALLWPDMPQRVDRQVLDYLIGHPRAFPLMIEAYESEEMALHCGVVFRSCMRHRELVTAFLETDLIFELIRYSLHPSIDISSDAFYSLREVLLEHKDVSSQWLESHLTGFFVKFNDLLQSEHYVLQRQALTLLCEVLLNRKFQSVMSSYVCSEKNLQIVMNLLRDSSKVIQVEAFQLFKIFVANPAKPIKVQQIMYKNRAKLVALLGTIPPLRAGDRHFLNDRQNVIDNLEQLRLPLKRDGSSSPIRSGCRSPSSPSSPMPRSESDWSCLTGAPETPGPDDNSGTITSV